MSQLSIIIQGIKKRLRPVKYILLKMKYTLFCLFSRFNSAENCCLCDSKSSILFITHSLGGGTYQFEKNFIKERVKEKIFVLRIISYGQNICYVLENQMNGKKFYIFPTKLQQIFSTKYQKVIINSLVQNYDLFNFIDLLLEYKIKYPEVEYTYHVHDFHCICPSLNLVVKNWYCNLSCKKHNCFFDKFIYGYDGDIGSWRRIWEKLLLHTDKIVCFSESSKQILVSVYPSVEQLKILVLPHDMSYSNFSPVVVEKSDSINIGIIGACSYIPKGQLVIERLFREVSHDVCFSMIGSYKRKFQCDRDNVSWYGKYRQQELQTIVEKSGVNLVIFPSVCPETFSYLISEIIQMDIPILCFDIGAQGEKVKAYKKGYVCRNIDEMLSILGKLNQF